MSAYEKLNAKKGGLGSLQHSLLKLELLLQERGLVALKSQEEWLQKHHVATVRQEELDAARSWSAVCRDKLKQRTKMKRQIEQQCLWVDTISLSGFHQRYRTENLRSRIYDLYFQSLCEHIVIRAEIIATERQMMRIQEGLTMSSAETLQKVNVERLFCFSKYRFWWMMIHERCTSIGKIRQKVYSLFGASSRQIKCCGSVAPHWARKCLESGSKR